VESSTTSHHGFAFNRAAAGADRKRPVGEELHLGAVLHDLGEVHRLRHQGWGQADVGIKGGQRGKGARRG